MDGKLLAGTFVKFAVNSPIFRIVLQANPTPRKLNFGNRRVKMSLFCKVATVFGTTNSCGGVARSSLQSFTDFLPSFNKSADFLRL